MNIDLNQWKFKPKVLAILLLGFSWLIYGAFFASTGYFSGDEMIYTITIDRFANAGTFVIENGYELVPARSLSLLLLIPGTEGLVMQYPVGYAVLAAPFYLVGGLRGVIFLNTLASVISLLLTYKIAKSLFDDEHLAATAALLFGFATYAVDYAFSMWPHATANVFVAGGIYAAILSVMSVQRNWQWAALAGLVIGLGVSIRVGVFIAAPLLFIWIFVNARNPVRTAGSFVLFLGLGLSAAAWLNYLKFGVFNPLAYGRSSGGTAISDYVSYIPYGLLAGLLMMSLRWKRVQQWVTSKHGWLLFSAGVAVMLVVPAALDLIVTIIKGLYVLLIDLESHNTVGTTHLFVQVDSSHYLFYGILKKSLVQSLPYLGLALFTAVYMFQRERRAAYALCLLMPLAWFLPFTPTQWVGGLANNMRYFTPVLPLLAILGAIAWRDITSSGVRKLWLIQIIAIVLSIALMFAWAARSETLGPTDAFTITGGAQLLVGAISVLSVIWLALPAVRSRLRPALVLSVQMGVIFAMVSAYAGDFSVNRERRIAATVRSDNLTYIEENAHVIGYPLESFSFQITRPQATLSIFLGAVTAEDIEYINIALDQDRPVYISPLWVTHLVKRALLEAGYSFGPSGYSIERSLSPINGRHYGLYKLTRATQLHNNKELE